MKHAALYWTLALAVLAGGGLLTRAPGGGVVAGLDHAGLSFAHGLAGGALDGFMAAVTWLGSIWLLLPLAIFLGLFLWHAGRRRDALLLGAGLLGAAGLAQVGKAWVARPRPDIFPALVDLPVDAAYPSGHTMQAVAFALALALVVGRRHAWAWPLLAVAALLVAWSRIHLQVHFPSDVLAGALVAALWVAGLKHLLRATPAKAG
jgi:undecaprenyl-diphosphatase